MNPQGFNHDHWDPAHEIRVWCVDCGGRVIVGGYIDDIPTNSYRCLGCRPIRADNPAHLQKIIDEVRESQQAARTRTT